MPTCTECGGKIVFRHVNGQVLPIHTSGSGCLQSGQWSAAGQTRADRSFRSIGSYVNPNARCPVCDKIVFFYQSPSGGRAFFDALGWPWPKHGCTDSRAAQRKEVESLSVGPGPLVFKNAKGENAEIYLASDFEWMNGRLHVSFRRIRDRQGFRGSISAEDRDQARLTKADLQEAPSFVVTRVSTEPNARQVDFICARRRKIVTLAFEKGS